MATYSPKAFAEKLGVTTQTLRNWDYSGKLKAYRRPSDRRYYTQEQLDSILKPQQEEPVSTATPLLTDVSITDFNNVEVGSPIKLTVGGETKSVLFCEMRVDKAIFRQHNGSVISLSVVDYGTKWNAELYK